MLAWGEKSPSRAEMMPSPRSATAPDPRRSSSLPVGNRPSASTRQRHRRAFDRRFIFTRAETSPSPDELALDEAAGGEHRVLLGAGEEVRRRPGRSRTG